MDCELHAQTSWTAIAATAIFAGAFAAYSFRWHWLRRRAPRTAADLRPFAFASGMVVAWIVIGSPLSALDHDLLTFHMIQHLLLMTVAAPLLLAGNPAAAFACATEKRQRFKAARDLADLLRHPLVCWLAGTTVVLAWHVPAAHELAMISPSWHLIQQLSFLAGGLLFWRPVLAGGASELFVPLYLLLATFPCDALSAFLAFCGRVVYAHHRAAPMLLQLSPLEDQQSAGALMWLWVTIAYLVPAVAITLRLLSPRAQRLPIQARQG